MIIRLDFAGQAMLFNEPIDILMTNQLADIEPYLAKMHAYVEQGYYVVGYLAYESSAAFNHFNQTHDPADNQLPLLLFGVFNDYISVTDELDNFTPQSIDLTSNITRQQYADAIDHIKQQIKVGNTYQTNYTIQFSGQCVNDPYRYYRFLQSNNQANYCAYIEWGDMQVLSISPELFFELDHDHIKTKPMKGTAARGKTIAEDKLQLQELLSEKNQAENMMIVDLLRNDLSRISKPGAVTVTSLFAAEKYPTVWQLTSTIESQLKADTSLYHIFQALFPCGSITGAPKASTMKVITEREISPREVYCGTIGYIAPQRQKAVFNIPIRTLMIKNGLARYGVGGGITWDSTQQGEYNELLQKTAILNAKTPLPAYILESLLLDGGEFLLLEPHLARLADSADYFSYPLNSSALRSQLNELANSHHHGQFKVRVRLNKQGELAIDIDAITHAMPLNHIELASTPVHSHHTYLYHKTSNRAHFPILLAGHESISHNEKGEITEFVNGNIAVLFDNQWFTPPITSGLLPGTMRQFYLDSGKMTEQTILLTDLERVEKMAFINSVRQWIEISADTLQQFKRDLIKPIELSEKSELYQENKITQYT
ncbi:aminodeoxychorismate synthase subunit I /aminodeoxychorismate lyase apoprotein [Orbus hercynius]|uniref:Aminodeoxychorismate synthase subunit I /aminodeoxychorismate lyase apoprotein n=1 Tax=Orbus hercynius TaxID=593135 RepID=A0A495RJ63_9GAMM|nr:aminodeoxychorismate synthase component I [Orbus hercynius]RKS87409.1 aminodeoxychorismate synthase subunit I /aminodeoxychorismate lyase apoprotein [Orbus hercynius]